MQYSATLRTSYQTNKSLRLQDGGSDLVLGHAVALLENGWTFYGQYYYAIAILPAAAGRSR